MRTYGMMIVAALALAGCGGGGGGGGRGGGTVGGAPTLIGTRSVPGMVVAVHTTTVVDTYRVQITGAQPTLMQAWLASDPLTVGATVSAIPQAGSPGNWTVTLPRSSLPSATCVWIRVVDAEGNISEVGQDFLIGG